MIAASDDDELGDARFVQRVDDSRHERTTVRARQKGFRRPHAFRIAGSENDSREHTSVLVRPRPRGRKSQNRNEFWRA